MRKITEVIIHHAAVEQPDINKLLSSIQRTHKERIGQPADKNWSTIAYHFLIGVDWEIRQTRDLDSIGWHTASWVNSRSIGICLSGNFDARQPYPKQYIALNDLLSSLQFQFPGIKISYHNDYTKTKTCPGRMFDKSKVLNPYNILMSIFKEVREREVKESERIFSDYKDDNRPITVQDAKYLIDIAISRDNVKDKNFIQRTFENISNMLKK